MYVVACNMQVYWGIGPVWEVPNVGEGIVRIQVHPDHQQQTKQPEANPWHHLEPREVAGRVRQRPHALHRRKSARRRNVIEFFYEQEGPVPYPGTY